ncbi:hypothetical protein SAMN02910278_01838 [Peptostreptococcus sp. D1]|nr:hypothetical protein SAMN02910278_01838 [Peptostreptococcus sp. D1]
MVEVQELSIVDYLIYRRDAFIYSMNQSEKGREYLDNAFRLEQTTPDRNALSSHFKKGAS